MSGVAVARAGRAVPQVGRRTAAALVFVAFGLLDIFGFGIEAKAGDARFGLTLQGASVHLSPLSLPAGVTAIVAGIASIGLAALWLSVDLSRGMRRAIIAAVLVLFVLSFLCWSDVGKTLSLVGLLQSSVDRSIPIVFGAMAGCLCERAGVINIAIEGQLLFGAFAGALVASASGSLWLGVLAAALAGALLGLILAVFAIRYVVNQIIVGVVLNVLATGLTGYFYDRVLVKYQNTLNSPTIFNRIRIPGLASIPIVGPVLFDSTIFLYLAYVVIIVVQIGLFRTRWGLRVRAVGEHPVAAETVGIRVLFTRYRNVVMGGFVAGLGGAYLTIGALGAALLFGFADALQNILSVLGTAIPSDFLLMTPYVVTIIVVAGMVGKVRPPKADGQPYVKT